MCSNKEQILFIFEGSKTEDILVNSLEKNFFGDRIAVKSIYGADIYQLYKQLVSEELAFDLVELLRNRSDDNRKMLASDNRDSFAYKYLFFDYDAHATGADDEKIRELLRYFDNETENGKLFISYPMVEAIRHFRDETSFRTLAVKCKRNNCPNMFICPERELCIKEEHYKTTVPKDSLPQMSNVNSYDNNRWKSLIKVHLFKANELVRDTYSMPKSLIHQNEIFEKQIDKFISLNCPHVAVLSAFPLFILDYYGCEKLIYKLKN